MTLFYILFPVAGGKTSAYILLDFLKAQLTKLGDAIGCRDMIPMAVCAALAVVVGLFSYRLIKLWMGLSVGGIGYFVGTALFTLLDGKADMPDFLQYVFGGIIALAFLYLGFHKFSYVFFGLAATIGSFVVITYFPEERLLAAGGAILAALLAVFFFRIAVALISSFVGGMVLVGMLGELASDVEALQFQAGDNIAFYIGLGITVVFFICQLLICKPSYARKK